jgi:excisionase family DNA binding protein
MPAELTTSQAAALLAVAPSTIRKLAAEGRLRSRTTDGGHRRFLESDVHAYRGHGDAQAQRAAVWVAAVLQLLRAAEVDLGPTTAEGSAFHRAADQLIGDLRADDDQIRRPRPGRRRREAASQG